MGLPSQGAAVATLAAVPQFQRWTAQLAHAIETNAPRGEVERSLAEDPAIAGVIYQSQLQAHMAGQLFVRAVEAPETLPRRALADSSGASFFRMPFAEALEAFLAKEVMTPEAFRELSEALRVRAFTATRLASQQVVQRAYDLLARHLADGEDVRAFIQQLRAEELSLGIEPSTPHYAENVFRSSVQSAYGSGRLAQLEHPAVVSARPLVQYRTAGDVRVRPTHAALNGRVFDRSKHDGWRRFAPPLGWQCRCALVTRREHDGEITDPATLEDAHDEGWTGPGMG